MPEFHIFKLDLSAAGSHEIRQTGSLVRFITAENAAGDKKLDAKVTLQAGLSEADTVPLSVGQAMHARDTGFWKLTWDAQAGITTAWFLFSSDAASVEIDADPPVQLLIGSSVAIVGGATITTTADVAVAATALATVLAANANRQRAYITNLAGNAREIRVGDVTNTGAARGREVKPGETVEIIATAAIGVYNPHTLAQSVALMEIAA